MGSEMCIRDSESNDSLIVAALSTSEIAEVATLKISVGVGIPERHLKPSLKAATSVVGIAPI